MTIWMCSGQGSQYYQMARAAYDSEPVFRRALNTCSDLLQPMLGACLTEFLFRQRSDRFAPFDRTLIANPAICAVQYSAAQILLSQGQAPDAILGYSIGEITAAILAGRLTLEAGLRIAVQLAEISERRLPEGGMLAVLADPRVWSSRPVADVSIAARNFPTHFVLTGGAAAIGRVDQDLLAERITIQRLPVRYAFHSPAMDLIEEEFLSGVAGLNWSAPGRHSIAVLSARGDTLEGPLTPRHVWNAVRRPIFFEQTIANLELTGPHEYIDLGPSGTLSTFVKYNLAPASRSSFHAVVTPFGYAPQARVRGAS